MNTRSVRRHIQSANDEFLRFTSSIHFDSALWRYDIAGSIAHARALAKAGVVSEEEGKILAEALQATAHEIRSGSFVFDPSLEDIHMNIEDAVTKKAGDTGAKLHTGRSRNDQVALDMRLMVRERLAVVAGECVELQEALLGKAEESPNLILPGYTHLQRAQPVLLSHHMLAHFWRLNRDISRLAASYARANVSPLGAGAIAGTSFPIDRRFVAKLLAMDGVTENSMDAVSDRDFAAESAFALSLLMIHLSSLSEELVLWSSAEFGFLTLPREMSSGSSMMPQKRNPDLPELVRGKSGRVLGDLVAILTLLKSLPLAYNRDLQEDKENLFDAFDTAEACLQALTAFLQAAEFDKVRTRKAAEVGLLTATDLADLLASEGVPFREAYAITRDMVEKSGGDPSEFSQLAKAAIENNTKIDSLDTASLSIDAAVERKMIEGGTSSSAVKVQIDSAGRSIEHTDRILRTMKDQIATVEELLKRGNPEPIR